MQKKAELAQEQGTLDVVQDTQVVTVPQIGCACKKLQ